MPHLEPPSESPPQTTRPAPPQSAGPAPPQSAGPAQHFECHIESGGRAAAWVRAHGELDLASAPELSQTLADALGVMRLVVLDLRPLKFIDSTGIHVIIDADSQARASGRRLVLVRGAGQVDRVLELLGLTDRLEIIDLKPALVPAQATAVDPSDAA